VIEGVVVAGVVGVQAGEIVLVGTGTGPEMEPQHHHCAYAEGLGSLHGKTKNQVGKSGCDTTRASTTADADADAGVQ
jgi:hypothetical protein